MCLGPFGEQHNQKRILFRFAKPAEPRFRTFGVILQLGGKKKSAVCVHTQLRVERLLQSWCGHVCWSGSDVFERPRDQLKLLGCSQVNCPGGWYPIAGVRKRNLRICSALFIKSSVRLAQVRNVITHPSLRCLLNLRGDRTACTILTFDKAADITPLPFSNGCHPQDRNRRRQAGPRRERDGSQHAMLNRVLACTGTGQAPYFFTARAVY